MKIKTVFSVVLKSLTEMVFGGQPSVWNYLLPRTKFNYEREVGDGFGSTVIMAPIFWIARTFPEAPVALEVDGEIEREHEMLDLLQKPNPFYSGHELEMATIISFSMQGNAYWIKIRNAQRKVIQLWYVPHWMMKPKWPDNGTEFISHYEYVPKSGDKIKIEIEDVVHFRFGLDPRNIRLGLSPMGSMFREIFTDDEASNFTASLLRNMGIPGVVISPDTEEGVTSPADKRSIKRFFKKNFGGDKRGEPLVLSAKGKVSTFGFSPQELDLGKLRSIPEERITALLGIPAAVVGFGTGLEQTKVGATMAELREMAYESCIVPMQRLVAIKLENDLLPDFEGENSKYKVVYDLAKVRVLQEDQNKKAIRNDTMVRGGWILVAEARKEMGLEVRPEHEIYLRSFNMIAVPAGLNPDEQNPVIPVTPVDTEPEQDENEGNGNGKRKAKFLLPSVSSVGLKDSRLLAQQFYKDWMALSQAQVKDLNPQFKKLGKDAGTASRQVLSDQGIEQFSVATPDLKEEVDEDDILAELIVAAMIITVLDYRASYLRAMKQTYNTINLGTGLEIASTQAAEIRILQAGGTRAGLVDLSKQTKQAVYNGLAEARKLNETVAQAARRIDAHVTRGRYLAVETRSNIIARTEMKYAQNMASVEAYREAGITHVEIVDGLLPTSDDECIERNGDIVTIAEAEAIEEHPNGTLSFVPFIPDN